MTMQYDPNKYETWRPNFELKQSLTWFGGCAGFMLAGAFMPVSGVTMGFALCCAAMGLSRFKPALRRHAMTLRLAGTPLPYVTFDELQKKMKDPVHRGDMWLGKGFIWGPTQTHRIAELMKRDWDKTVREALGPIFFFRYLNKNKKKVLLHPWQARHEYIESQKRIADQLGYTFIHGVGDGEDDLFQKLGDSQGHVLILGTTGSGKTRAFDMLISQAVLRGETVFIIDPKGDHDLREKAKRACDMLGRGDKFVSFHPAFPDESIKINLLANWTKPSELASRIAALMPAQNENDPFKAFAFSALNAVCAGLVSIYRNPTLKNLKHYLAGAGSGAIASLVIDALDSYLAETLPNGRSVVDGVLRNLSPKERADDEAVANTMVRLYQQSNMPNADMDGLISMFTHNREHFGKMITSLLPLLSMLTSGPLGEMLSPPDEVKNRSDNNYHTTSDLVASNNVVYVGLDSLSDSMVASAIGGLFLSDLSCFAGTQYNHHKQKDQNEEVEEEESQPVNGQAQEVAEGDEDAEKNAPKQDQDLQFQQQPVTGEQPKKSLFKSVASYFHSKKDSEKEKNSLPTINVFVDEASEVANAPFLQLLNKGRGADFKLWVATQTFADFAARMASKEKATQLLGNLNNRIILRCVDPTTQKFAADFFPKTKIASIARSQNMNTSTNSPYAEGGGIGERLVEEEVPMFQPELLGMLPNLEFIASLSGGRVVKGRYPLILADKSEYRS